MTAAGWTKTESISYLEMVEHRIAQLEQSNRRVQTPPHEKMEQLPFRTGPILFGVVVVLSALLLTGLNPRALHTMAQELRAVRRELQIASLDLSAVKQEVKTQLEMLQQAMAKEEAMQK